MQNIICALARAKGKVENIFNNDIEENCSNDNSKTYCKWNRKHWMSGGGIMNPANKEYIEFIWRNSNDEIN